jgi:hypothetical protein
MLYLTIYFFEKKIIYFTVSVSLSISIHLDYNSNRSKPTTSSVGFLFLLSS